jgi:hypothetical protein
MVALLFVLFFTILRALVKDGCATRKRTCDARFSCTGTTRGYLDGLNFLGLYDDKNGNRGAVGGRGRCLGLEFRSQVFLVIELFIATWKKP